MLIRENWKEIENMIERSDKMYGDQRARANKLSNRLEKLHAQEVKKLRKQLQQKENIIKEVREYIEKASYFQGNKALNEKDILEILDKENK